MSAADPSIAVRPSVYLFMGSSSCPMSSDLNVCVSRLSSKTRIIGTTEPINWDKPTEADLEGTKILSELLHELGNFEGEEEAQRREQVLGELNQVIQDWATEELELQGRDEHEARQHGTRLHVFGSYRLGVHSSGADIDTLIICPRSITRSKFFGSLYEKFQADPEVKDLVAVEEAFAPVIKMDYHGIEIDLLFATVAYDRIPEDFDLFDDDLLLNLAEADVRSLNGVRVTDMILKLVPQPSSFALALRLIKIWAAARGIYSNILGYLGGVSWAILIAKVCQLYPTAEPARLLSGFFLFYSMWKWPLPITIAQIRDDIPGGLPVWNQEKSKDLMPILTPAYPSQNSTYNVSKATLWVMQREFRRGHEIMEKLKRGVGMREVLLELIEPSDMFLEYKNYLHITVCAGSEHEQHVWGGFVLSKMRQFIRELVVGQSYHEVHAQAWPKPFKDPTDGEDSNSEHYFIGLEVKKHDKDQGGIAANQLNLSHAVEHFKRVLLKFSNRTETMDVQIESLKARQLPEYVFRDDRRPPKHFSRKKVKKRKRSSQKPETAHAADPEKGVPSEEKADSDHPPVKTEPGVANGSVVNQSGASGPTKEEDIQMKSEGAEPVKKKPKLPDPCVSQSASHPESG